ncbi:MAG: hypothetical protein ABJG41_18390 [Cyclobacteriaceae bacterium]
MKILGVSFGSAAGLLTGMVGVFTAGFSIDGSEVAGIGVGA